MSFLFVHLVNFSIFTLFNAVSDPEFQVLFASEEISIERHWREFGYFYALKGMLSISIFFLWGLFNLLLSFEAVDDFFLTHELVDFDFEVVLIG